MGWPKKENMGHGCTQMKTDKKILALIRVNPCPSVANSVSFLRYLVRVAATGVGSAGAGGTVAGFMPSRVRSSASIFP